MQVTRLHWGVKESFRRYVEAAGGKIETRDGAERTADGAFAFSAAPGSDLRLEANGKLEGLGTFLGEIQFEAHGGMLSVKLSAPALEIGPDGAILTVADERGSRLEIARLDLSAATSGDEGGLIIPAALSLDGSYVLGDHYPPRTALDPVSLATAP